MRKTHTHQYVNNTQLIPPDPVAVACGSTILATAALHAAARH